MKKAIARKKDAHKEMCKSGTETNKARYKNMKNRAKKVVTKAEMETTEQELSEHPNKVFKIVKSMKKDGKDDGENEDRGPTGDFGIEGNSGSDGKGKCSEMVQACKRKRGQTKKMWKMQVENKNKSVGLEKKDAMNQVRWRVGVGEIAVRVG